MVGVAALVVAVFQQWQCQVLLIKVILIKVHLGLSARKRAKQRL